jgi:methionyl-tRNA formyltransferase
MKIYILNTLEIGINSINILKKNLDISGVIGLSERDDSDKISGYKYLKRYCHDNNLQFIEVESYTLSSHSDKEKLLNLNIDILIVSGWQRLIPSWLIGHCNECVIGSHGSVHGITGGRGRSPQNWALLLGKKEFYISIFKIDEGIDSGSIIDTKSFVLSELDDIKTSYYKVSWLTSHMIIDSINNKRLFAENAVKQEGEARYLPQRLPEDGEIDWSRTSKEIYDFIRALTKPYPGAFSYIGKEGKIVIWKGIPFEINDNSCAFKYGEIVKLYDNSDLLVKTGDSFLLIDDYTGSSEGCIREGSILLSRCFEDQISNIIDRHYRKYPQLILSDDILSLVGNK